MQGTRQKKKIQGQRSQVCVFYKLVGKGRRRECEKRFFQNVVLLGDWQLSTPFHFQGHFFYGVIMLLWKLRSSVFVEC